MAYNAKKTNESDFINLYTEVKEMEMLSKYKSKNILKERLDLFQDFIKYLTKLLYDSYLGSEYIKTKEDKDSHYNWAFNKCCESFKKFTVDFSKNIELLDYLKDYFSNTLYNKKISNDKQLLEYFKLSNEYWAIILTYSTTKTRMDLETMFECYDMFNISFGS
jgi:hypothetical protein